ncbi:MAG: DNA repair protein RecO [Deltaproteobacteria bacterium]|jgi:DNA repair protein RecO (recombination protein O)|nr:DNA repair protein RecO [Deltaproteobacteria bacterium]
MKKTHRPRIGTEERRLPAVVLAKANSGEADLVVTFLTREMGLVTAFAKNARKSVKRFGGGLLSPARAAWFDFRIYPNSDLFLVARGESHPAIPLPSTEPLAMALSSWAVELVKAFEAPRNPAPYSFNLLLRHLIQLAKVPDFTAPALEGRRLSLGFTKSYLELAGFGPTLTHCRVCGAKPLPSESWLLNPAEGAAYCPQCLAPGGFKVKGAVVKALGDIVDHLTGPHLAEADLALAEGFLAKMATMAADRTFRSRTVLTSLLMAPKTATPCP